MSKEALIGYYVLGNHYQGKVVDLIENGFYLVQLYEWFTGSPNKMVIMSLQELREFAFYSNAESWREAGAQHIEKEPKLEEFLS